jgi:signal transduction histidine kinase
VGIRLKAGDDYPYYEARGFPEDFLLLENSLCERDADGQIQRDNVGNPCIACMCGNVICGRFDPAKPFFSPQGSFWTNGTTELLAGTTDADRQARTRNRCNGQGYESVALIPLRIGDNRLGLLQLNDRRKGMFTAQAIALWERLSSYLAVALAKSRAEEALRQSQALLQSRLRLAELAQRAGMDELMQAALDEAELRTGSTVGFFHLVDKDQENLTLQAWSTNTLQNMCKAEGKGLHYPIKQAGVWVDCFHARAPVIHNDYASLANKKGLPPGHAPMLRDLAVPVIRDGAVVAIIGVGNKPAEYAQDDVDALRALASPVMDLVAKWQAEDALRKTVAELERSNRELEQFAYISSHDLQEPLRQVRAFVGLLRDRHADKLEGSAAEYLQFVYDGAARMSDLVQGLLDYSRVGARERKRQPVSCQQALDAALANLQAGIAESNAQITHDELPTISAEPVQLTQLFQNLIGNAIKFRPAGVAPAIHVGSRRDAGQWLFWVKDNGIGIAPEFQEKVFQIFQRLHTRRQYPGTGIGLAICKKIVEQHGGKIWIESAPGQGSTFHFSLPQEKA